jgi:hypothetical protein
MSNPFGDRPVDFNSAPATGLVQAIRTLAKDLERQLPKLHSRIEADARILCAL